MKFFKKNKKFLFFSSKGCSILRSTSYLIPFRKIKIMNNDFNKFKKVNKNEKYSKSVYIKNFFQ